MLMLILLLVFQFSFAQTQIAKKALQFLSEKTNHEISIDKVRVAWLDKGEVYSVLVRDLHSDTLFYSDQVTVNYNVFDFFSGNYLSFEEILVESASFNLIRHKPEEEINISYFIQSLKSDKKRSGSDRSIRVGHVELSDMDLRIDDKTKPDLINRTDFSNLDFSVRDLNLFDLELRSDTITGDLKHFTGFDKISSLSIEKFQTVFRVSNQALSLDDLDFRTKTSHITDSLEFFYNGFDDLSHFTDSVSFIFHFDEAVISEQDLKMVVGMHQVRSDITLDGIFWGTVGDFNIEDSRIGFGNSTYLRGGVSCFGLPNLKQTFILADITESRLDPNDLVPYVGDLSNQLARMGNIDFVGSFAGFPNDFLARGDFYTDNGSIYSDIHIEIPADPLYMSYDGNLELENVDVGAFFENEVVQNINLKTKIKGKGISRSTADFVVDTKVFESELKGYRYDSIHIIGKFAENFFSGQVLVDDPNCKLSGDAEIDLRSEKELLSADFKVDSIFFDRLNLSRDSLHAQGSFDLEIEDFDFDKFQARITIDSSLVKYKGKSVLLDSILFKALYNVDSVREINLAMPGLTADLDGIFKITDLIKDAPMMTDGYLTKLHLKSDTIQKQGSGEKYKLNLDVKVTDISPYLDSLGIPLNIFGQAQLEGIFRQGKGSNFSLFFNADSLKFKETTFHLPVVEVNGALDNSSGGVLTNFIIESSRQRMEGIPATNNFLLEGVWYKNDIDISASIAQPSSKTDLNLETIVTLSKDSILIHAEPSDIYILDDEWKFNPSNQIVIKDHHMEIENMEIFDSSESISLQGYLSDSSETSISISVEDLKMDKANLFTQTNLDGYLNGDFEVFRKDSKERYRFDGGFFLKNLKYDDVLLGDLSGNSRWDPMSGSIYSEVSVSRENFRSIDINGYYYPLRSEDQLSFLAKFNDAELVMAKPFLEENFSEIRGTADGEIKITGELTAPKTDGTITVKNGSSRINYLNTVYTMNGDVRMNTNSIDVDSVVLTDRKGNTALANGKVSHSAFSNVTLDLTLSADNFEFLNTTFLDNELYYGAAYGTGLIGITGALNDLLIKADVKTDAGTRFFIPVSESTDGSQKEFIEFVSFLDSTKIKESEKQFRLSGLTLDFDLEITPDAYCELIFDVKKGDIIRGRGRGNLKLTLNTDGEFSMFGGLEITEGYYNFTFSNLINKEFEVVPGGRISWYGDPYSGSINLNAQYVQRASLDGLQNPEERSDELATKIPFLAIIKLDGEMLAPNIAFDIQPQNEGDLQSDNGRRLLNQVLNDEQELSKQFVSLLFLKKFSPTASFFSGEGTNLAGSVSEVLANQVSYLFSQIDENLEVELDLADLDQEAFNTFQLRLAYTFLDGRLKVTSGGNFGNGNSNEQNSINEIVGDWSVEYSLTQDGRLRVKAFRNANQLITADQQSFERGVSLKFVDSFDRIKDILRIRREAAIRRKEEEEKADGGTSNYPDSTQR